MRKDNFKRAAILMNNRGDIFEDIFEYIIGFVVISVGVYFLLGYGVNAIVARIPVSTEKQIFSNYSATPSGKVSNSNSGNKNESLSKLQKILNKLVDNKEVPALDYRLFIINQDVPNAVAMPGGRIGVTKGLIKTLDEETALAFVLGHELGHFRYRDHLRGIGRAMAIRMIITYFLGESDIGRLVGANALELTNKKFSRKQEEAADRFGVTLVFNSYGSVDGTTRLFEILQKSGPSPKWAYMFSTHPAPGDRITALRKYAEELKSGKEITGGGGAK